MRRLLLTLLRTLALLSSTSTNTKHSKNLSKTAANLSLPARCTASAGASSSCAAAPSASSSASTPPVPSSASASSASSSDDARWSRANLARLAGLWAAAALAFRLALRQRCFFVLPTSSVTADQRTVAAELVPKMGLPASCRPNSLSRMDATASRKMDAAALRAPVSVAATCCSASGSIAARTADLGALCGKALSKLSTKSVRTASPKVLPPPRNKPRASTSSAGDWSPTKSARSRGRTPRVDRRRVRRTLSMQSRSLATIARSASVLSPASFARENAGTVTDLVATSLRKAHFASVA
mmetsp:Transcript_11108/g.35269  ORF Transcript_11108/g.35269 Transcript_11108/m.35269 type:complete len:298 (+) Transcript_11108:1714-2607(+)